MNITLPLWVDLLAAVLVLTGAFMALVGSFGLVRLRKFFQRVHPPTLGATVGTWTITIAGALQFSFLYGRLDVSSFLIALFIAITVPVTTIFLMRAALFRSRIARADVPPSVTKQVSIPRHAPRRPPPLADEA